MRMLRMIPIAGKKTTQGTREKYPADDAASCRNIDALSSFGPRNSPLH
jgi:hypothetical protein